jgi:hypothetical protein
MRLEDKIETIIEFGWFFSVEYNNKEFSLSLCRPEWITNDLSQSVSLPTAKGKTLLQVVDWGYNYVSS